MYWFVNIEKVFLGSLIALSKSLHHCFLLENNYDFAEKRGDYLDKTGKKAGLKKAREAWNMLAWTQEWFNQTPEKVENRSCLPLLPSRTLCHISFRFSRGQNSFRWISFFSERLSTKNFQKDSSDKYFFKKHAFYELDVSYASQHTFPKVWPLKFF